MNETGQYGDGLIIRGTHTLLFDTIDKSTIAHRLLGESLMLKPEYMFIEDNGLPSSFTEKYFTNVRLNCTIIFKCAVCFQGI